MRALIVALLLASLCRALAQPADCVADPPATASVPLMLNLQGLPGVPNGISGALEADVPAPLPGGTRCVASPLPPSTDVLAGPPGDVLRGPPTRDVLRGPVPRVEVETR